MGTVTYSPNPPIQIKILKLNFINEGLKVQTQLLSNKDSEYQH
jgi:hypothetical protein